MEFTVFKIADEVMFHILDQAEKNNGIAEAIFHVGAWGTAGFKSYVLGEEVLLRATTSARMARIQQMTTIERGVEENEDLSGALKETAQARGCAYGVPEGRPERAKDAIIIQFKVMG